MSKRGKRLLKRREPDEQPKGPARHRIRRRPEPPRSANGKDQPEVTAQQWEPAAKATLADVWPQT